MPLEFVNVFGTPISQAAIECAKAQGRIEQQRKKEAATEDAKYHKGWRVVGVPKAALDEARQEAAIGADIAAKAGRIAEPFNEQQWLMNAKTKPVRSKPYELREAAEQCKALAEKSGIWLRVQISEISKGQP